MKRRKKLPDINAAARIAPPQPLTRKVNLRLTQEDYGKLLELRMVLHSPSDSHTLRALVRMHWSVEQAAVRAMRRNPRQLDLLEQLEKGRLS